jgi:hypothetical protein
MRLSDKDRITFDMDLIGLDAAIPLVRLGKQDQQDKQNKPDEPGTPHTKRVGSDPSLR